MAHNPVDLAAITRNFLKAYEARQIDVISRLFSQDVILRDWNYEVQGFSAAIAEFEKNFREAENLEIKIIQILTSDQSVAAELEILVNGTDRLAVVDVLNFDAQGRISSIFAYKGA